MDVLGGLFSMALSANEKRGSEDRSDVRILWKLQVTRSTVNSVSLQENLKRGFRKTGSDWRRNKLQRKRPVETHKRIAEAKGRDRTRSERD